MVTDGRPSYGSPTVGLPNLRTLTKTIQNCYASLNLQARGQMSGWAAMKKVNISYFLYITFKAWAALSSPLSTDPSGHWFHVNVFVCVLHLCRISMRKREKWRKEMGGTWWVHACRLVENRERMTHSFTIHVSCTTDQKHSNLCLVLTWRWIISQRCENSSSQCLVEST